MAIVKMKKTTVIALNDDKDALLRDLMWLSAVDVNPLSDKLSDDDWKGLAQLDSAAVKTEEYDKKLDLLSAASSILKPYSMKKGIFQPRNSLSRSDFESFDPEKEGLIALAEKAIEQKRVIESLQNSINRAEQQRAQFKAWLPLNIRLNEKTSKNTSVIYGTLPVKSRFFKSLGSDTVGIAEEGEKPAFWCEELARDKMYLYIVMIYYDGDEKQILSLLGEHDFSRVTFPGISGTPRENLESVENTLKTLCEQKNAAEDSLKELAQRYDDLERAIDILSNEKKVYTVRDRLLKTDTAFVLEGWYPIDQEEKLNELGEKYGCVVVLEDPKDDEEPPIKLKNNRLVAPFENVTNMYALPTYRGLDPNFMVAPFYFLLFGIMLSDAGLGLILTVGCFLWIKLLHPKPGFKSMLEMFMYCGISTIFWGLMFGTFFGDSIGVVAETFFGSDFALKPILFDPVTNPLPLLGLSFAIGYIHVMVGIFLKGYMLIRDKKYLSAIFDVGFWVLMLIGLPVFAGGMVLDVPIMAEIGKYMSIAAAVGLICTQGRHEKNILKKIGNGVMSLYDITGYLADILSYSRILALGLSAGVIGSVFNKLGTLFGGGIVGAILFVIIFIVGHSLNAALSTLGSYVHASRLCFIEFFSKFYESGGRAYDALRVEGKYSDIQY